MQRWAFAALILQPINYKSKWFNFLPLGPRRLQAGDASVNHGIYYSLQENCINKICNPNIITISITNKRFTLHFTWDVIKWNHSPRYWPFVRGNHPASLDSPHKGQRCVGLMFSLIYDWTNGWANINLGDFRRHHAHYDVLVMLNLLVSWLLVGLCSHRGCTV